MAQEADELLWARQFPAASERGAKLLRRLDAHRENWLESGVVREVEWDAAVRLSAFVCAFAEALVQQPRASAHGTPFRYHLRLGLQTTPSCDCVWAPVVCYCLHLLSATLLLSIGWEAGEQPPELKERVARDETLSVLLGYATYVHDRVLVAWLDVSTEWLRLGTAPRARVAQLRGAVRAYALWNRAWIASERSRTTPSGVMSEALRLVSPASTQAAPPMNAALLLDACRALYEARRVMQTEVPAELLLSWGQRHQLRRNGSACDAVLRHQCVQPLVLQWDEKSVLARRTALAKKAPAKPAPSVGLDAVSWPQRLSLEWVIVMGVYLDNINRTKDALACLRCACLAGAEIPGWVERETQYAKIAYGAIPDSLQSLVSDHLMRREAPALPEVAPVEWGTTGASELSRLLAFRE